MAVFCRLTVVLGVQLREVIAKDRRERKTFSPLDNSDDAAHLAGTRIQRDTNTTLGIAVYRAPKPITPRGVE